MTEKQWLAASDPVAMVEDRVAWMQLKRSRRKLRLCSCACCFALGDDLSDKSQRNALLAVERYADGLIQVATLSSWWKRMNSATNRANRGEERETSEVAICRAVANSCQEDRFFGLDRTLYKLCDSRSGLKASVRKAIRPVVVGIIRDIFGSPFRKATIKKSWRTDTAIALARTMYESREFGAMPILADALQDAGCDSDDILNHCRDAAQVHVRGCWVVDLVLGKS